MDATNIFSVAEYSRSFDVVPHGNFPTYKIIALDNRQVPNELSGQYSRTTDAKKAIMMFLHEYEKAEVEKAKWHKRRDLTKRRQKYEEKNAGK